MAKNNYQAQFSIYKLDYERAKEYYIEEYGIDINSEEKFEEIFYEKITQVINSKNSSKVISVNSNGFRGILFKTYHNPIWSSMAKNMIKDTDSNFDLVNSHISYILSYRVGKSIFLLTAGLGSNYIYSIVKKNYGLYLLPKILDGDCPAVKEVLENKMFGNKVSSRSANRTITSINIENELSSIFRELSLEFNNSLISEIGIEIDMKKKNNLNIIAKDSFVVRKSVTLEQLEIILNKLLKLEMKEDSFILGYFISVKKCNHTNSELNNKLVDYFCTGSHENFIIVGDNYSNYYLNYNNYKVEDKFGEKFEESENPIEFQNLFNNYFNGNFSKSMVEKFLKLNITASSDDANNFISLKLKEAIQGFLEIDEEVFYLFNGEWLQFDNNYLENLKIEYQKCYDNIILKDFKAMETVKNRDKELTEDQYNCTFETSLTVILCHKVMIGNIELADLIYYDDDNVYLFHNKDTFDGAGARDVMNQILLSSEFLSNSNLNPKSKKKMFEEFYNKIILKYGKNGKMLSITLADFNNIFENKKIYYVAGFMHNLRKDTNSNYAKYLTIDISKRLSKNKHSLLLFDINKEN